MNGVQPVCQHFTGSVEMAQVGAGIITAGIAGTGIINGMTIFSMRGIADI